MTAPIAWLFNFDADRELAAPGYTPSLAAARRMRDLAPRVARLLRPGDVVLPDGEGGGLIGRAWCPTPSAIARIARAGAIPPPTPPLEVLQRVNARRFSAELGQTLLHAVWTDDERTMREAIRRPVDTAWCLKRAFSTSGSGRRVVDPGELSGDEESWALRSLQRGGLQIEPWLERSGDFAIHGHVSRSGELVVGDPCTQRCNDKGQWLHSSVALAGEIDPRERAMLVAEAEHVAIALVAAGYFGPFNVDAFRYRRDGTDAFNPRCEINARYSMGWAIGMGDRRPDRLNPFG